MPLGYLTETSKLMAGTDDKEQTEEFQYLLL